MNDNEQLKGIIVPLIVPIRDDETPDYKQLEQLTNYVIKGGVNAIFVNGTTGEFARFHGSERLEILKTVIRVAEGRVPILAGVSECGTRLSIENAVSAQKAGADYIVTTFPYYFPTTSPSEQISYISDLAKAVSLPIVLYNIPAVTGYSVTRNVLTVLTKISNFYGIKDTSGDMKIIDMELNNFHDKMKIFIGDERLTLYGLQKGGDGIVPSMANCFPRLWKDIWDLGQKRDWEKCRQLCAMVDEMNKMNTFSDSWMSPNIWRKEALHQMNVISASFTRPYNKLSEDNKKTVARFVATYREKYE